MIEIAGERIFYVDFHCQWCYRECPELFLAGLSYEGFDAGVMVIADTHEAVERAADSCGARFVPIRGREYLYSWGHIVCLGYYDDVSIPQSDVREVLRHFRSRSDLVIFAHPLHVPTREAVWDNRLVDELLAEGLFDAIELMNADNYERDIEMLPWYENRIAGGLSTPITAGCDVHYLHAEKRPASVYRESFAPGGDIKYLGENRTLVLAGECTSEAIVDAVMNCRTLVEANGRLLGPPALADKLIKADYWRIAAEDLARKRSLSPLVEREFISASPQLAVPLGRDVSQGKLIIAGSETPISGDRIDISPPPVADELDDQWSALTVIDESGASLTSALHVLQPMEVDFFGLRRSGDPRPWVQVNAINNTNAPLTGTIKVAGEVSAAQINALAPGETFSDALVIGADEQMDRPREVTIEIELQGRRTRQICKELTFVACRRACDGEKLDWSIADVIHIDRSDLVLHGNWDGPADSSASIRWLWSSAGLHMQAHIRDDHHEQPYRGNEMFQGDSIQIGLDPTLARLKIGVSAYEFVTGLSETGAELFCINVPREKGEQASPLAGVSLPDSCAKIEPVDGGLIYELLIPNEWLDPLKPSGGQTFGLFLLLFDNDGPEAEVTQGCKSLMQWPAAIPGWKRASRHWAVVTLVD